MGNSKIEFSYYNGLVEKECEEKCVSYLRTKNNIVTISKNLCLE